MDDHALGAAKIRPNVQAGAYPGPEPSVRPLSLFQEPEKALLFLLIFFWTTGPHDLTVRDQLRSSDEAVRVHRIPRHVS